MTLDDFAAVIQRDIARMATKDDVAAIVEDVVKDKLWPIRRDLKTLTSQLGDLRGDIKQITDVMVSKADLAITLGDELVKSAYTRQIEVLQNRVNVVEEKLGIKPTRWRA